MSRPTKSTSEDAPQPASAWQRCAQALGLAAQPRVVQQRQGPEVETRAMATATARTDPELALLVELTALLDAAPGSRDLLRYLAAVEHGLTHKDPAGKFLFRVEPDRLKTALRQLDGLLPQSPSNGLSTLRARIVAAISTHENREKVRELLAPRSDLMQGNRIEVGEGRASEFDRLSQQWRGQGTGT